MEAHDVLRISGASLSIDDIAELAGLIRQREGLIRAFPHAFVDRWPIRG